MSLAYSYRGSKWNFGNVHEWATSTDDILEVAEVGLPLYRHCTFIRPIERNILIIRSIIKSATNSRGSGCERIDCSGKGRGDMEPALTFDLCRVVS